MSKRSKADPPKLIGKGSLHHYLPNEQGVAPIDEGKKARANEKARAFFDTMYEERWSDVLGEKGYRFQIPMEHIFIDYMHRIEAVLFDQFLFEASEVLLIQREMLRMATEAKEYHAAVGRAKMHLHALSKDESKCGLAVFHDWDWTVAPPEPTSGYCFYIENEELKWKYSKIRPNTPPPREPEAETVAPPTVAAVRHHLTVEQKTMLLDAAAVLMEENPMVYSRNTKSGIEPNFYQITSKLASMFPTCAHFLKTSVNLGKWWKAREAASEGFFSAKPPGRPCALHGFEKHIQKFVDDSNLFGVPLAPKLLWTMICDHLVHSDDLHALRECLTDSNGDLWKPSYRTFRRWLRSIKITMRSTKKSSENSYPENINQLQTDMLLRMTYVLTKEHQGKVHKRLICNVDETAAAFNGLCSRGLGPVGAEVTNMANTDKRNCTLIAGCSMDGDLLDPYIIWNGKETCSGAKVKQYPEVVQYQTANHYISVGAMIDYIENVLKPYYDKVMNESRDEIPVGTPLLLLIDCCSVHVSRDFITRVVLEAKREKGYAWLRILFIPARCTGKLQPLDVGLFNRLKPRLRTIRTLFLFHWCNELREAGKAIGDAKSLGAVACKTQLIEAVLKCWEEMRSVTHKACTAKAWEKCGITEKFLKDPANVNTATWKCRYLFEKYHEQLGVEPDEDDDDEFQTLDD